MKAPSPGPSGLWCTVSRDARYLPQSASNGKGSCKGGGGRWVFPFDCHGHCKTPEAHLCINVYLDLPQPPKKDRELLVPSSRKWKLMCSHPKHFILFVLSFISLPGLLLLFPLFSDLLDCILLRNKGSAFLAGILGRPPRTLAHAVQFRTTFNNNKNAWLNGSKMWSVRGIHLSLGHCHNTDRPQQIPLDGWYGSRVIFTIILASPVAHISLLFCGLSLGNFGHLGRQFWGSQCNDLAWA